MSINLVKGNEYKHPEIDVVLVYENKECVYVFKNQYGIDVLLPEDEIEKIKENRSVSP